MRKGKFITFEGLDGTGKSTQIRLLAEALGRREVPLLTTREPGGTPIGDQIRALILDSGTKGMGPLAELALMFASRAQHVSQVILPALKQGTWVLCDRFTDSSEAYQGGGRGLGSKAVLELHRLLCGDLTPDLTLLLVSPATSVQRARQRNRKQSKDEGRFEQEEAQFYERVRKAYLKIAAREPKRVVTVPAGGSVEAVHKRIVAAVEQRLKA